MNNSKPAEMSPMDAALSYLTSKMRSVREVEERLDYLQYGEGDILATVDRLKELNLLNDREYAEEFVRSRLASKPVSRQKLFIELKSHKIPDDIIEPVLNGLEKETEAENACQIVEKYKRQMNDLEESVRRERILRRLLSRGFSFETSIAAIRKTEEEQP